jgi:hypothetical protein
MFDLLPENSYSRKAVRWGLVISVLFVATEVFGLIRHHYEDGFINIVLGVAVLFIWTTRRREPPLVDRGESKATRAS